jgi:phage major head subunit gpT-like protein
MQKQNDPSEPVFEQDGLAAQHTGELVFAALRTGSSRLHLFVYEDSYAFDWQKG